MSRANKTLDNSKKLTKKRAEDLIIRRFLGDLLKIKSNKQPEDDYNYDPIDDVTDSMAGLSLNSVINAVVKRAVKKSLGYKCSKCGRSGHNSQNCLRKKKKKSKQSKKGKVNLATEDSNSDSSSDTSSSDSSDSDTSSSDSSDSDGGLDVHMSKIKKK